MVVTSVYGYIDKQTDGIDRHGDRHKDREIWRYGYGEKQYILFAYLSGLSGLSGVCWLSFHFGSVHFGSGWFDWFGLVQIFDLHKKIF